MRTLERFFHLTKQGTTVRRELLGALTSFFSVAYILFVTPSNLSLTGMDYTGVLLATCLSSALACFLSAAFDLPFMLAPGVGLNAFFTYTLCLTMGYTWEQALAVVSLSGVAYLIISLTPLRDQMISCIPPSMKNAISAGLGLFIALIGLLNSGIVRAENGALLLGEIGAPATFLAILGLLITGVLMAWKVKGAMLIGIVVTTLLGFPLGVTQAPESMRLSLSSLRPLLLSPDFGGVLSLGVLPLVTAVVTFTMCLCFDTLGALICIAGAGDLLDEKGGLGRYSRGMTAVALSTAAAPLLGAPPIGIPVEGSTGVADGARTGLYAAATGVLFLAAILLAPIAGIIPGAATSPALVLIGMLMIHNATNIYWHQVEIALPCFLTMIMIPFTYSVADGIGVGFISYTAISLVSGKGKKIPAVTYLLTALFVAMYVLSAI
ncbi:NCS2 family permease [uncultured Intestinimonas sp.]|uniref:NCS2 family permease n=1 Tax=uncultured Intestinimonas sp. TaxID=1689265 RepID=UPI0025DB1FC5|nr:NCS2 family permease [uncultured Intestinimonas sp.]